MACNNSTLAVYSPSNDNPWNVAKINNYDDYESFKDKN